MKLSIKDGAFYINNLKLCLAGVGNGRSDIPNGRFEVTASVSHRHGRVLPQVHGFGWIGFDDQCDVVLGNVRSKDDLIPCQHTVGVLLAKLELAEDDGKTVWLEVA